MSHKIRWGILGTGNIAAKFAEGLSVLPDAELAAVGSRSQATADAFALRFNVARRHASYEALAADSAVDAVYVSTLNPFHAENTLMLLEAGKPVLCEKPFTINAGEAESVVKRARAKKLLLMEAMWTRFLPSVARLREMVREGMIGDVRMLTADFGFYAEKEKKRLFDKALGGGTLLDIGIYPISLASMLFGTPTEIKGVADLGPTGVDEQAAISLKHARGQVAMLHTSFQANTMHEACLMGTKGKIKLHAAWWKGTDMTVSFDNGGEEFLEFPFTGNGYQFEAAEFMQCLRQGRTESAVMPLDETLSLMKTMDTLRTQWGVKYPMK
jgi:predicted dehydrogenase